MSSSTWSFSARGTDAQHPPAGPDEGLLARLQEEDRVADPDAQAVLAGSHAPAAASAAAEGRAAGSWLLLAARPARSTRGRSTRRSRLSGRSCTRST